MGIGLGSNGGVFGFVSWAVTCSICSGFGSAMGSFGLLSGRVRKWTLTSRVRGTVLARFAETAGFCIDSALACGLAAGRGARREVIEGKGRVSEKEFGTEKTGSRGDEHGMPSFPGLWEKGLVGRSQLYPNRPEAWDSKVQ